MLQKGSEQNFDKTQPLRIFNKIMETQIKKFDVTLTNAAAKDMLNYKNYKKQLYKSIENPKKLQIQHMALYLMTRFKQKKAMDPDFYYLAQKIMIEEYTTLLIVNLNVFIIV